MEAIIYKLMQEMSWIISANKMWFCASKFMNHINKCSVSHLPTNLAEEPTKLNCLETVHPFAAK